MTTQIGKVIATEKAPSTVDEFYFWTKKDLILKPFDVIKVKHIKNSHTFGVIEEISHITDSASFLAGFISSDFGDVDATPYMERIGMNYVKARVVGNTGNIYTPVLDGYSVSLADEADIKDALGLSDIRNPLPCGYITMYEENPITIPVHFNSHFLIGPEGAHLNISGISGLASKTSYAMFLLKAIQTEYQKPDKDDSVAFVILNVKGRDLLALDESNEDLKDTDKATYEMLGVNPSPFQNVKYFYPFARKDISTVTYGRDFDTQQHENKAFQYKYTFDLDKNKIDMLFSNIDDSTGTMESIVAQITSKNSEFASVTNWSDFREKLAEYKQGGNTGKDKEISVLSWRKFSRHINRVLEKSSVFNDNIRQSKGEVRLEDELLKIKKNDVYVIDVAKLEDEIQGFVFGDIINAIYDLKLGQTEDREEADIPSKVIIFIDELNKYASNDVPKNSPILRRLLEVTERGRSLGIILFSVEQFKSVIHDRVKGNCSTHAYGRTNAIEVSKSDYRFIPPVYKSMMTRLDQGEYILENPIFRSLLNIKFPRPVYRQFKNG
jgi:uncharacterized protein